MELSRRELLAGVAALGGTSGAAAGGTAAAFRDTATATGTLQADTWTSRVVYVHDTDGLSTAKHGVGTRTYGVASAPVAGPKTELFDGRYQIPFVNGSGELELVTADGSRQTLATGSTTPRTSKSILAADDWNGSGPSVFYATSPDIYYVAPADDEPTHVASLGNGAKAVLGAIDVDGDGTRELTYVDGSGALRYLKPAKEREHKIPGGFGSNNQFGVGEPLRTAAGPRVPIVGGSNQVALRHPDGSKTDLTAGSTAAKTAVATGEVAGDDSPDVVFLGTYGELQYVTDLTQQTTPQTLTDGNGNPITAVRSEVGVL